MSANWPADAGPKVKYVTWYRDRPTFQRRKGSPRVTMLADPRTDRPAFDREYLNMMAAQANGNLVGRGVTIDKTKHRDQFKETAGDLATLWRGSDQWKTLKRKTTTNYATFLDRALLTVMPKQNHTFGEMKVAKMLQSHAVELRGALPPRTVQKIKTEACFRDYHMAVLRNMFHWALTDGAVPWVTRNPFARLKPLHGAPVLNYAWRPENWQTFLGHYPLGTQQHLAMLVLRYLGVRVSDLHLLGANNGELSRLVRDHRKDNKTGWRIEWVEWKNSTSEARPIIKKRSVKVHPVLWNALQKTPGALERPTFLVSRYGEHYSVNSIGETFNQWCADAGLPAGARAHGVRRGGAKWLAENNGTMHQIKGWGGWATLANVQRYTGAADQAKLGDHAVDLMD
jgi:site-specific recombinase XerC